MERIENVDILVGGQLKRGTLVVGEDGMIADIIETAGEGPSNGLLLPGCVDGHVHFREPGLTQKADIATESLAAAAGGVTTVLDMPNVNPVTTTPEALAQKHALYKEKCLVNYGLWYGITAHNIEQALADYGQPDSPHRDEICGFKVFLGSSTGGMLMNDQEKLRQLFQGTQRVIGIHSESEDIIRKNREKYLALYGTPEGDVPVEFHPKIRDVEACMSTTKLAVELALETGAHLHVCHLTTQEELDYVAGLHAAGKGENITTEVTPAHLTFSQEDYKKLGTRIKCNPAIKRVQDRDALRQALSTGKIFSVGTDHAPHLLSDKQGGALKAASGMPSIQFSLLSMLKLVDEGYMTLPQMVEMMSTHPAQLFGYDDRGVIAVGKRADLVLIDPTRTTTVNKETIKSKCGWSPFEGMTFNHRVAATWVNGRKIYEA
ncbi:MAG: dihydroorotase [Bacteroidales bacterium]|nr:dihydroorotase [Bacteroidales bacterium]